MKKITTTVLLLFLALLFLPAQAREKKNWFIGISPFSFMGAEVKSSAKGVTQTAYRYDATEATTAQFGGISFQNGTSFVENGGISDAELAKALIAGSIELCKRSHADDATSGTVLIADIPLEEQNASNDNTGWPGINTVNYYIGYEGGQTTAVTSKTTEICHLSEADGLTEIESESLESLQSGLALQFGYNLGKYRVSLTSLTSKGEVNTPTNNGEVSTLTNNILMVDWLLAKRFYVGVGVTNARLETEIGSESQVAPAYSISYSHKIGNLKLEAGYLVLNSNFSIQKETITEVPASGASESQTLGDELNNNNWIGMFSAGGQPNSQGKVTVTRTLDSNLEIETKKVELQSQKAIYFRIIYGF